MIHYNKLVRDKIPEIIRAQGEEPVVRAMDDAEYIAALEAKLTEECGEYLESKQSEELADILEVIYALAKARGCIAEELTEIYRRKHAERGGFERKIFLIGKE